MLSAGICNLWMKNRRHIGMVTEAGIADPESSEVNIHRKEIRMNEAVCKEL